MAFNLNVELEEIRRRLEQIGTLVAEGAEQLRQQSDFGVRCLVLAEQAQKLAATLPPPQPSPPQEEHVVTVMQKALKRANWLRRQANRLAQLVWWRRSLVDGRGMVPVAEPVTHTVKLPVSRFPGSPAEKVTVEVEVVDVIEVPWEHSFWRLLPGFIYQTKKVPRSFRVPLEAVPPDAPLTAAQSAYLRRQEELKTEVRDLTTFLDGLEREVRFLQGKMKTLVTAAGQLEQDVANLPRPEARGPELNAIRIRLEAIEQGLPRVEQEINASRGVLEQLKQKALEVCPELKR